VRAARVLSVLAVLSLCAPSLHAAPEWHHTAFSLAFVHNDIDGIDDTRSLDGEAMFRVQHGSIGIAAAFNKTDLVNGDSVTTVGVGALYEYTDTSKDVSPLFGIGIIRWVDEAMFVYDWKASVRLGFTAGKGPVFAELYGSWGRYFGPRDLDPTDLRELFLGVGFRK
jgi:hypothetical protein